MKQIILAAVRNQSATIEWCTYGQPYFRLSKVKNLIIYGVLC